MMNTDYFLFTKYHFSLSVAEKSKKPSQIYWALDQMKNKAIKQKVLLYFEKYGNKHLRSFYKRQLEQLN